MSDAHERRQEARKELKILHDEVFQRTSIGWGLWEAMKRAMLPFMQEHVELKIQLEKLEQDHKDLKDQLENLEWDHGEEMELLASERDES